MIGLDGLFIALIGAAFAVIPVMRTINLWMGRALPTASLVLLTTLQAVILIMIEVSWHTAANQTALVLMIMNNAAWLLQPYITAWQLDRDASRDTELVRCEALVASAPCNPSYRAALANAYLERRELARARAEFEAVITMLPDHHGEEVMPQRAESAKPEARRRTSAHPRKFIRPV